MIIGMAGIIPLIIKQDNPGHSGNPGYPGLFLGFLGYIRPIIAIIGRYRARCLS